MSNPVVTTKQGQIKGIESVDYKGKKFFSFLGIPYGKPPIGELRFKASQPAEPWTGIYDATKEGPESPSLHMFFNYFIGCEEKCLNLNVFTKELTKEPSKLRPVMVWIHGGGYIYGSNKSELYGPDYLMSEDIVLVQINYRLGILGFLSLEDSSLGVPGNAGLKDMVLALKWVQKNIVNFGGDPNNVTIFGESAGAASVHFLLLSPMTKGLFHKAILQSGCALNCWAEGIHNGKTAGDCLGYKETEEKQILVKLRNESAKKIVVAQHKLPDLLTPDLIRPFSPVVEKPSDEEPFLSEDPLKILKEGKFNKVPVMIGCTTREGFLWEIVRKTRPNVKITKNFEDEIPYYARITKGSEKSKEIAAKIKKFYFGDEEATEENIDKFYELKGDVEFLLGIHNTIKLQQKHAVDPIYFYVMSLQSPLNYYKKFCFVKHLKTLFLLYFFMRQAKGRSKNILLKIGNIISTKEMEGACHADDVGYLFTNFFCLDIVPGSAEDTYIQRFLKLWTNFARYGNPTPEENKEAVLSDVAWNPTTEQEFCYLDIGEQLKMGVDPDVDRIKFWNEILSS